MFVSAASSPASAGTVSPSLPSVEIVRFRGAHGGGGPTHYDQVRVARIGSADAPEVIVLVPGWFGGAGSLVLFGRRLVELTPNIQAWIVERREQGLIDSSRMRGADVADMFAHYLSPSYRQHDAQTAEFAREWGLSLALDDLRIVIRAARDHGRRRVILGGHSWGATTALSYAAWDFNGRAGYRDLSGLVLIDGGVHGAFAGSGQIFDVRLEQAEERLSQIAGGDPFDSTLSLVWGYGDRPASAAMVYQLAGVAALRNPAATSALDRYLPRSAHPPRALSNLAMLGWLTVEHAPIPDLSLRAGHPAGASDSPAGWMNDGESSLEDVASAFGDTEMPMWEWFWPKRLSLDMQAIDPFATSRVTDFLGLRLLHGAEINVPLYVFATGSTRGTVTSSAQWVVAHSQIRAAVLEGDPAMTHLDPLFAPREKNRCLTSLSQFLLRVARRQHL
jgi:pimeloyl-ACP methyl ester carboxylesterase